MFFGLARINPQEGLHVGRVVREFLRDKHMQDKEAWLTCDIENPANWSHAISGKRPLDLWRLRLLGADLFHELCLRLADAAKPSMVKADLRETRKKECA